MRTVNPHVVCLRCGELIDNMVHDECPDCGRQLNADQKKRGDFDMLLRNPAFEHQPVTEPQPPAEYEQN